MIIMYLCGVLILQFALMMIHGSGRAAKSEESLGALIMWPWIMSGGCEVEIWGQGP